MCVYVGGTRAERVKEQSRTGLGGQAAAACGGQRGKGLEAAKPRVASQPLQGRIDGVAASGGRDWRRPR
jgi:hypothetical protein